MRNKNNKKNVQVQSRIYLFALSVLALSVVIAFHTPAGSEESLDYLAKSSEFLAQLKFSFTHVVGGSVSVGAVIKQFLFSDSYGLGEIVLLTPQTVVFQFIGISEFARVMTALFAYIAGAAMIYLIGIKSQKKFGAFLAALFWMLNPANIFYASQAHKESILILMFLTAILLILTLPEKNKLLSFSVKAIALVLIGSANYLLALSLIVWIFWMEAKDSDKFVRIIVPIALLVLAFRIKSFPDLLENFIAFLQFPAATLIILVSLISFAATTWKENDLPSWLHKLFICIAVFSIAPLMLSPSDQFSPQFVFSVASIPLAMYFGLFINKFFSNPPSNQGMVILLAVLSTLLLSINSAYERAIPDLTGASETSSATLIYALLAFQGLGIVFYLLSPILKSKLNPRFSHYFGWFLLMVMAGSFIGEAAAESMPKARRIEAGYQAFNIIDENIPGIKINILLDRQIRKQFAFLSQYSLPRSSLDVFGHADLEDINSGLVLFWEQDLALIPEEWILIQRFGKPGSSQLNLSWVADDSQLDHYSQENPQGANFIKQAIIRSKIGDSCQYLTSLSIQGANDALTITHFPIDLELVTACQPNLNLQDQTVLLMNSLAARYLVRQYFPAADLGFEHLSVYRKYQYFRDSRVFNYTTSLDANSLYLYSVSIIAVEPVSLLYYATEDEEGAYGGGSYKEWTTHSIILATPNWDAPKKVLLSPVIFDHYGEILIRNFYIERIDLAP